MCVVHLEEYSRNHHTHAHSHMNTNKQTAHTQNVVILIHAAVRTQETPLMSAQRRKVCGARDHACKLYKGARNTAKQATVG